MPAEVKEQIRLEVAHVLFIDTVGYSKLSINEQRAVVEELTSRSRFGSIPERRSCGSLTEDSRPATAWRWSFTPASGAPAQCAIEISGARKAHPRLQVRMGIHSGPVSGVVDVNGHANLAGAGINIAQRVMDCGDAGHILLSKHVAEDLEEYEHWRPLLHDLGTCEVKHGARVSVDQSLRGSSWESAAAKEVPGAEEHIAATCVGRQWQCALLVLAGNRCRHALFCALSRCDRQLPAPEKSVAVLPFENRSERQSERLTLPMACRTKFLPTSLGSRT